jgi:hypothetical protein
MKHLKLFENFENLHIEEDIEHLHDILLELKEEYWDYSIEKVSGNYIKLLLESTIEYNYEEIGSEFNDDVIAIITTCLEYMKINRYSYEITSKNEDDEHEYSVSNLEELKKDNFKNIQYLKGDYIIIRFIKQ